MHIWSYTHPHTWFCLVSLHRKVFLIRTLRRAFGGRIRTVRSWRPERVEANRRSTWSGRMDRILPASEMRRLPRRSISSGQRTHAAGERQAPAAAGRWSATWRVAGRYSLQSTASRGGGRCSRQSRKWSVLGRDRSDVPVGVDGVCGSQVGRLGAAKAARSCRSCGWFDAVCFFVRCFFLKEWKRSV